MDIFSFLAERFDLPILDWISATLWCPALDAILPFITHLADAGLIWIVLTAIVLCFPKYRKTGLCMGLSLLLGLLLCNVLLKPLAARPRPYDYQWTHFGNAIPLLISAPTDYSFPSGHTIASFEAATALFLGSKRFGIPALIFASLIAFSRLYLYVHYPTDVLAAMLLGVGIAFFSTYLVNQFCKKKNIRI